jgi:hypothetical protein
LSKDLTPPALQPALKVTYRDVFLLPGHPEPAEGSNAIQYEFFSFQKFDFQPFDLAKSLLFLLPGIKYLLNSMLAALDPSTGSG